jgi:hypothetical protein
MTNGSGALSDFLIRELEHRREKQWKIFSWASTIFTAIIGGVIVLKTRDHPHHLNYFLQWTLTWVVAVLLASAAWWVAHNGIVEREVMSQLEKFGIVQHLPRAWVGYRTSLALLAVAAVAAIWIPV